jgi:hypothetical protein
MYGAKASQQHSLVAPQGTRCKSPQQSILQTARHIAVDDFKPQTLASRRLRMQFKSFGSKLSQLWHRFAELFAVDTEPHIWKTRSHGHILWHTYDPDTGESADFASEDEVRIWIENRYYAH